MNVRLIPVPYHLGRFAVGMGRGPLRLLEEGAPALVQAMRHHLKVEPVEVTTPFEHEIASSFEVIRTLAVSVRSAFETKSFPIVLSGNCNSSLGIVSAMTRPAGVIWFDAHGDFNTPETTPSGYLDGMALAQVTGRCWKNLTGKLGGFRPVPENRVVLVGARDLDPGEKDLLEDAEVRRVTVEEIRERGPEGALASSVRELAEDGKDIYLHVDLDVLDTTEGRANQYASPGGLRLAELQECLQTIGRDLVVRAAALTAYDPAADEDGRAARAGLQVIEALVNAAEGG